MANTTLNDAIVLDTTGELTPEAEQKIHELATNVSRLLQQAENPEAAAAEYLRIFREGLIGQVAANTGSPTDTIRVVFARATTTCWERRPGRHPLTGELLPGATETDWSDRLPCTELLGHDDDHQDARGRTWVRAEAGQ